VQGRAASAIHTVASFPHVTERVGAESAGATGFVYSLGMKWSPSAWVRAGLRRLALAAWAALMLLGVGWLVAAPNLDRMLQLAGERYGPRGTEIVTAWRRMLTESASLDETGKLNAVNTFFNRRVRFAEDTEIWQQADYWATPLEFMGRGAGDCEDYAIAKYMSLLLLNVPADRLRMTYVRARIGGPSSTVSQAHMVLGYYPTPDADPQILDNLVSSIRPGSMRTDLQPVFSFSIEGLWTAGSATSAGDPLARLSRWREVLEKMAADGTR
jgi:predicted transglutaminase-like cysteine proteinase